MNVEVEALLRTLPRKIRIGAYDWRVVLNDTPREIGIDLCGEAVFEFKIINLWPESLTSPDHAVGIVLHEIYHVIWDNHGLEDSINSADQEEEIVIGFENGMVCLLRDNPRLLTWIKKGLKPPVKD